MIKYCSYIESFLNITGHIYSENYSIFKMLFFNTKQIIKIDYYQPKIETCTAKIYEMCKIQLQTEFLVLFCCHNFQYIFTVCLDSIVHFMVALVHFG